MSLGLVEGPQMSAVFETPHQTYSILQKVKETIYKAHYFCISEIDTNNKRIVLETFDPKNNYTLEQFKEFIQKYKVILVQRLPDNQIVITVTDVFKDKIATNNLVLCLKNGSKTCVLCKVDAVVFVDNVLYKSLAKDYLQFLPMIVAHNKKQEAVKK